MEAKEQEKEKASTAEESKYITSIDSELLRLMMRKGIDAFDCIAYINETLSSFDTKPSQNYKVIKKHIDKNLQAIIYWDGKDSRETKNFFADVLEHKSCVSSIKTSVDSSIIKENDIKWLQEEIKSLKDQIKDLEVKYDQFIEDIHEDYTQTLARLKQQHKFVIESKEKQISRLMKCGWRERSPAFKSRPRRKEIKLNAQGRQQKDAGREEKLSAQQKEKIQKPEKADLGSKHPNQQSKSNEASFNQSSNIFKEDAQSISGHSLKSQLVAKSEQLNFRKPNQPPI